MEKSVMWRILLIVATAAVAVHALPASLVQDIKNDEMRENKVKRASPSVEENSNVQYYNKPSASKRGGSDLKNPNAEQRVLNEWSQLQADSLPNVQSGLFDQRARGQDLYDDKTLAEYEKGFRFGADKDRLDEALENAVLKSEYYDPGRLSQYRYYGADDRRRRRRAVKKFRLNPRLKRDVELTPDEILTILQLYEKTRQQQQPDSSYRKWLERIDNTDQDPYRNQQQDEDEENWLDSPVYPHEGPAYTLDDSPDKRGQWSGFADVKKRFMVARKRNDPTRELRHLNGPSRNDYYALSAVLNEQRDPLYQRLLL